jgi:diguanylate cyclase (GGDEF)-like protein
VTNMHQGVLKLRAGHYDHRLEVTRRDELGVLTDAFNGMAGALHESHLALTFRATHDPLTGLLNRASLTERLTASFGSDADGIGRQESVLFIDVDDFKEVNDSLGHEGGDALLVQLAARMHTCIRAQDMLARLGGDEFAVVVVEDDGIPVAAQLAERILSALRAPFTVNGTRLVVSVSIGAAYRRPETVDAAELLRSADFAMYMAKGSGKDRYQLFDAQERDDIVGRSALRAELALAAAAGQLRLDYQPVVALGTGEILGVEALVRWQHPTRGLMPPADFIPLSEETGDIAGIGCWVLQTASRQAATWRHGIERCANLWVSVNLSPFQLVDPLSVAAIERILGDPATEAGHVVLEVTETAFAANITGGAATLTALKEFGVRVAIDDFGTGFASLSALTSLPIDILKIDRSLISPQGSGSPSVPMLEGILGLADKLGLHVIAEGIEAPAQLDLLRTLGCPMGQGYLFGRPAPAQTLEHLLSTDGPDGLAHLPRAATLER